MVNVKSLAQIQANYTAAAATIPQKYSAGVQASTNWQANAAASEELYAAKMQQAIANKSRQNGINKVSNAEWQSKSLSLGAQRIGAGVTAGAAKQAQNFAPYKAALESVTLPARTADPISNVQNRVIPVVQALVNAKAAQK